MAQVDYSGYSIDPATLPEASLSALMRRGMRVVFSNEAMARVNAAIVKTLKNGSDKKVSTDDIKAWREANENEYEMQLNSARDELMASIHEGTLGQGRSGDSLSLTERVTYQATKSFITDLYAKQNKGAAFLTINAHKRALGITGKSKATQEMLDYVAGKEADKIEAFTTSVNNPEGKLHKYKRALDKAINAALEEAKSAKVTQAPSAEDDVNDLE